MNFSPVVPFGGYAGWKFLGRTIEAQKAAFAANPARQRDQDYFRVKIGTIDYAEDLVNDRRLLSVALGAFGLDADIGNKYFIRKVLEDGTLDPKALANRLADKRYFELSKAFGFGDFAIPSSKLSDFPDKIIAGFDTRQFEAAIGTQNDSMRLALNAERELGVLAGRSLSNDVKWFTVMGSAPLRTVMQTALGLPQSFAGIDLDRQLTVFQDRAERLLGSSDLAQFSSPESVEKLVRLYLLRAPDQAGGTNVSGPSTALAILQSRPVGAGTILSLLT